MVEKKYQLGNWSIPRNGNAKQPEDFRADVHFLPLTHLEWYHLCVPVLCNSVDYFNKRLRLFVGVSSNSNTSAYLLSVISFTWQNQRNSQTNKPKQKKSPHSNSRVLLHCILETKIETFTKKPPTTTNHKFIYSVKVLFYSCHL